MAETQKEKAIKAAKAEYKKRWRAKNKERVKRSNERYWLKKAEELGYLKEGDERANDD